MYEAHWQLDCRPFENTDDSRFYYPGETHQGAMLKLRYAIENRRGGALVCGPSGCGKTLLVHQLRRHLGKQFRPLAHVVFPQMPAAELLSYLADELGAPGEPTQRSIDQSVRRIQQLLGQNAADGQQAVLVIDEAHMIDDIRVLEALRLLLNFEHQGQPALMLLLVGQSTLLPQIERTVGLDERLAVKCVVRPFNADETAAYVNFRLQAAGAKRTIFEPDALTGLYELTHGLARQINRLCDLALLVGFAEDCQSIGAEQLEAVVEELVTIVPE